MPAEVFAPEYQNQLLAALTAQIITFSHGVGVGWLSPTLLILQSSESPVNFPVGIKEASWIGATLGLGSIFGNIVFGLLLDRIGRKRCMYLLGAPFIIQWFLIYFAQRVEYLYVARFLGGVTGGGSYVVIPIFISEIANNNIRGALSSMAMLLLSSGVLVGYILSAHLPYHVVPMMILMFPLVYLILALRIPDTSQYLIKKQRLDEAVKSLKYYANQKLKSKSPDEESLKKATSVTHSQVMGAEERVTLKDYFNQRSLKAFTSAGILMALNQFSGSFSIFNYSSLVFTASGTAMDPNTCTIILGVTQIVGTFSAMWLVDHYGRKSLLLISAMGMALGMTSLGCFVEFVSEGMKAKFSFMPLILIIFTAYLASIGVIPLIFVVIVEILPKKIRSMGTSICMAAMSTMVFITLKMYPIFIQHFGISFTMYFCSSICLVTSIYLLLLLPETRGKSMDSD